MSRTVSRGLVGSLLILAAANTQAASAEKAPKERESAALAAARKDVDAALRAEAAGDNARRAELLATAGKAAPALPEANWHLAQVHVADKWLPLAEAEQRAASDPILAEYRKLRDEAKDNPKLLQRLAHWCLKQGWEDTARLHYSQLLASGDADAEQQQEAIQKLDLHNVNGSWISGKELTERREKSRLIDASLVRWRPRLLKLQAAIDGDDFKRREWAIKELEQIDDPRAIPAFETFLSEGDGRFQEEIVRQLARIPDYAATEALVRFAVQPKAIVIRDEAIKALRERSLHEFCPLLLGGLTAPIESRFEVQRLPNGMVTYRQALSRDLPDKKLSQVATNTVTPRFVLPTGGATQISRKPGVISTVVEDDTIWRMQQRILNAAATEATFVQLETSLTNAPVNDANRPVFRALRETTGQQLPDDAGQWWQWWQDYNEYQWPKPTYYQYTTNYSQYVTRPPVYVMNAGGGHSCFLAGTRIRSLTGLVPVESIQPGDRVLSQDQDTGELAYKLVLRTTLRPPAKMVRVGIGDEQIVATLGHPFWVDGHGWKMAKELTSGDLLHSLGGAVRIDNVETAPEAPAHNLIVDGFNTYFVGQQGLLVHDNEFRKPTRALVPGLSDETVAVAKSGSAPK
jgi:hypothetical protein